jgi:hypothetical protein
MDPPSKEAQLHPIRREHTDQRAHQRRQTAIVLHVHLGQDQGPTKGDPEKVGAIWRRLGVGRSLGSADLTLALFEPSFHVSTPSGRLKAVWGVIHSVTALNSQIMLGPTRSNLASTPLCHVSPTHWSLGGGQGSLGSSSWPINMRGGGKK